MIKRGNSNLEKEEDERREKVWRDFIRELGEGGERNRGKITVG